MRNIIVATLVAAGVALVGISAGSAFPMNNTVVRQAETMTAPTVNVQYYRRHCHGYYSHWHWC
jgi:hypothetical protein